MVASSRSGGRCGGVIIGWRAPARGLTFNVVAILVALATSGLSRECAAVAFPPSETLLPASTRVWVSVADPRALRKRFERSSVGGLVYDPLMSTFLDGLRQQGRMSADPLRGTLEITLEEIDSIAAGEIALAVIERSDGMLSTVVLIDTSGRESQVQPVVEAVVGRVGGKGGKPIAAPSGMKPPVKQPPGIQAFTLPVPQPASNSAPAVTTGATATSNVPARQLAIATLPSAVIVGDRLDAVAELAPLVGQAGAERPGCLARLPSFATIMSRCGQGVPTNATPVRWFVDPLAYLAADRRMFPPSRNKKTTDYVAILRRQGFDAVDGVGGYLFFGEGKVDLRHNTLVHAPARNGRPADGPDRFEKSARMLRFPNAAGLAPATWVPDTAGSWMSLQWDLANAFDAMPPLVDDVVGEAGVFEDVIASLEEDPDGPQIDVRNDLIKHLGKRCAVASDHETPIDPDCERMLIAIETTNPDAVAAAIAKGMTSESDVRKVQVGEHVIWETVKARPPAEETSAGSEGDEAAARRRARQRERQDNDSVWPNLSVAVAHGQIFLASHRDFLERVLSNSRTSAIVEEGGYREVAAELGRLLEGECALCSFSRTEKTIRPAYELLRAGRLPESKSLAGTLLRRFLEGDQPQAGKPQGIGTGPRKQRVDGSSLPDFEQIRRYFGVNGTSMQSTPEGWYFVGVGLWNNAPKTSTESDTK